MKEKHRNGCNILIMILTHLEKYVYSKRAQKNDVNPRRLSWALSKVFSRRKSQLATAVICNSDMPIQQIE